MNNFDKAVAFIRDRRRAELDAAHLAWQAALRADDNLYKAFVAYQNEMIASAKGEPNKLSAARAALSTQMRRMGISKADFDPPCRCSVCGDTGYANGKYCKCVIREAINSDRANLALPAVDFTEAKNSAPAGIKKVYSAAQNYIDSFPNGKPFFTVVGSAGTGKTYLAAAIATSLMSLGAAVVTVTAFDFVRRALDYHTQFKIDDYIDRFTPMIDCDLLVIDDLGKETMLKNVTAEYLAAVVNERWLHKKYTVVTSNLEPAAILSRYGAPITSRFFDKALSENFIVSDRNQRL